MNPTIYVTRNPVKAASLVYFLAVAGHETSTHTHNGHTHIVTSASPEQFAVIRADVNIPSSAPDANVPDSSTLPDTVGDMFPTA